MPIVTIDDSLTRVDCKVKEKAHPLSKWYPCVDDGGLTVATSTEDPVYFDRQNSFLAAVMHAYNTHSGLRLSPDDILHCLTQVVSLCINENSEKYRDVFVRHGGEKVLSVTVEGLMTSKVVWSEIISLLSQEIDANVKTTLDLESDFSTSSPKTRSVAQLMKMSCFKSYFKYMAYFSCGIREVDLQGTLEDWLALRRKVVAVTEIFTSRGDMVNFARHFLAIVDRMIQTYQMSSLEEKEVAELRQFWSRVVTYVPYGSGGQKLISGWVKVLVPGETYSKMPEHLNLLDLASKMPSQERFRYYDWQKEFKCWAQLCEEPCNAVTDFPIELWADDQQYDGTVKVGFVGWTFDGAFSAPELGYVINVVQK